jgi:hypothetical protein
MCCPIIALPPYLLCHPHPSFPENGVFGKFCVVADNPTFRKLPLYNRIRSMTAGEVQSLVREEADSLSVTNASKILLEQVIIRPERISLVFRTVSDGTYVTQHALAVDGPIRGYYAVGPAKYS